MAGVKILLQLLEAALDGLAVAIEEGLEGFRVAHQRVGGAIMAEAWRMKKAARRRSVWKGRRVPGEVLGPVGLGEIDAAHEVEEQVLAPRKGSEKRLSASASSDRAPEDIFCRASDWRPKRSSWASAKASGFFGVGVGQRLEGGGGGLELQLAGAARAWPAWCMSESSRERSAMRWPSALEADL